MRAGSDMRHVSVHLMREDLPQASLSLAELEAFAPDHRPLLEAELPEVPGQVFREHVLNARTNYQRLVELLGEPAPAEPSVLLRQEQLVEIDAWLSQAWEQCARCSRTLQSLHERSLELDHEIQSLDEFMGLDIDLGELQREHEFIDLFFGTIPASTLPRLQESLAMTGHSVIHSSGHGEIRRIIIAGIRQLGSGLGDVLATAGFQPIRIPPSFHSAPERVSDTLLEERNGIVDLEDQVRLELDNWRLSNGARLARARQLLDAAGPYTEIDTAARAEGPLAVLQGWLSAALVPQAERILQRDLSLPFVLFMRRPRADERPLVPVPPMRNTWLHAFAALVHQYGVPRFGEIDPTMLFALTFAAMFGMMFGDVGHGFVLILGGIALRRRLRGFTPLPVLAGLSAMLFGLLYGSVFGQEHWTEPLWVAPLSDPHYMLLVALAWGIVFLSLGSLIAIANRMNAGEVLGALFDPGGLFSLLFYYGLLGILINLAVGRGLCIVSMVVVALSIAPLAVFRWHESDASFGERLLTVFIELFEMVIGYLTSSLSFLRVAAFSMNHVALSLAVLTLAGTERDAGHWLTLVLGNLFIIVLEGMIVTIQTLRLEYYEGFSRYFYGDGQPFRPLRPTRRVAGGMPSYPVPGKGLRPEVTP